MAKKTKDYTSEMFEHLSYNSQTGAITWKTDRRCGMAGKLAGSVNTYGYQVIEFNSVAYLAHRLAWFLYYGVAPLYDIDHIDGNKLNNSINNLRDVKTILNMNNMKRHRDGKLIGAVYCKTTGKYRCRLKYNGKYIELGRYITAEQANAVYVSKVKELTGEIK